ncbi:hypothetical protein OJ252_3093 [Cryptosporidium canis]|uniref:PIH1 N-terminal domain-containing protein n=1 Tax=Cryptosporidium canis TaxID=195482 RepID=A0ABQ8P3D1_9CRYT|nr:hypothetical protein OJ252_3093 [Cryptosporidium canis]
MENLSMENVSEIIESLNSIMLTNPDLYLRLAKEELKNSKHLKVLDVNIKYIVKSNFVYIDISSPMTKDTIKLGGMFRLEVKIGFTRDMLKPQVKVGSQYKQAETLEDLNSSELTVSFDDFLDKDLRTEDGARVLEVEAVLHEMVYEKILKDEIFKYYMVSIIHDRVLLRLKAQIPPQGSKTVLEEILSRAKIEKLIPKSGTTDQIGFSKDEMAIYDLEFMNMKRQSIRHTLNLTCYTSYDELLNEKDIRVEDLDLGLPPAPTKMVEEVKTVATKKARDLPTAWEELKNPKGIQIKSDYLPIKFKASINSGRLVFLFQLKGPDGFVDNLFRANAHVSILSARVTYDSSTIIHVCLEDFIEEYHHCSLCKPSFDFKHSILMCNKTSLKLSLSISNICDAVRYKINSCTAE